MRNLIISLMFLLVGVGSVSFGQGRCANGPPQIQGGDYWPWGKEIEFPWKGIQGVWYAQDASGYATYFSFKVNSPDREPILRVEQYDATNCRLVSRGIGYEKDRIVRARLTGVSGDFDLRIHVFKGSDIVRSGKVPTGVRNVTVMSMNPAGCPNSKLNLQIYKIQNDPQVVCE